MHTCHFDWFECIDRTIRAKESIHGAGAKVNLNDVFTSHENLVHELDELEEKKWQIDDLESHLNSLAS